MNHAAFQRREGHAGDRLRRRIAASHKRLRDLRIGKSIHALIDEARSPYLQKFQPPKTSHAPEKQIQHVVNDSRPTSATLKEAEIVEPVPAPPEPERARTIESIAKLQVDASVRSRVEALQSINKPPEVLTINQPIAAREQEEADLASLFHKTLSRIVSEPASPAGQKTRRRAPGITGQAWAEMGEEGKTYNMYQAQGRPKETYVKVEKWHRDMVWRQKFDFFDRHIAKEVAIAMSPKKQDSRVGTPETNAGQRATSRPTSRDSSSGRPFSRGSNGAKMSGRPDSKSSSRRPDSRGSSRNQRATTPPGPLGSLQNSASAPTLRSAAVSRSAQERSIFESGATMLSLGLDEIKYYDGDDVLMHEDILHCSNPKLFPLQEHKKLFPVTKIPDLRPVSAG